MMIHEGTRGDTKGVALVTALLLAVLVAGLGVAMIVDANNGTRTDSNLRSSTQAFYAAKGGIEEARARIPSTAASPITLPVGLANVTYIVNGSGVNPTDASNAYYDRQFAMEFPGITPTVAPLVTSNLPSGSNVAYKWVRVTLKTESSSSQDVNRDSTVNGVTPVYFDGTNQNLTLTGKPVYKITALAVLPNRTRAMLQMEGSSATPYQADSAVASQDDVHLLGNFSIAGVDYCGSSPTVYALKTTGDIDVSGHSGTLTGSTGPSPSPLGTYENGPVSYNINNLITSLRPYSTPIQQVDATISYDAGTTTYSGSNVHLGVPPPNPPPPGNSGTPAIAYAAGNVRLTSNNSQGGGILIVDGDLEINGGLYYYGLIVVRGIVSFTGGGSAAVNIYGAIVSGSSVTNSATLGGGVNAIYDSCAVRDAFSGLPVRILAVRTITNF